MPPKRARVIADLARAVWLESGKNCCELFTGVACLKTRPDTNLLGRKKQKGSERELAASMAYTLPQVFAKLNYWFNGLKVRMVASAVEQAPAGSTRTTASSSAQNARIPVWLIDNGIACTP
jgi:hypothetical protein